MEKKAIRIGVQVLLIAVIAWAVSAYVVKSSLPKPKAQGGRMKRKGSLDYHGPAPNTLTSALGQTALFN